VEPGDRVEPEDDGVDSEPESVEAATASRPEKLRFEAVARLLRTRRLNGFDDELDVPHQLLLLWQSHHQGLQFQFDQQIELPHHGLQKEPQPQPPQPHPPQPQPQLQFQHEGLQPTDQPLWHQPSHHHGLYTYTTDGE